MVFGLISAKSSYCIWFLLLMWLVNISDTLSLSVETRGFTTDKDVPYSVYKTVTPKPADFIYLAIVIAGCVLVVIL